MRAMSILLIVVYVEPTPRTRVYSHALDHVHSIFQISISASQPGGRSLADYASAGVSCTWIIPIILASHNKLSCQQTAFTGHILQLYGHLIEDDT